MASADGPYWLRIPAIDAGDARVIRRYRRAPGAAWRCDMLAPQPSSAPAVKRQLDHVSVFVMASPDGDGSDGTQGTGSVAADIADRDSATFGRD
jgi:hypothetical protein